MFTYYFYENHSEICPEKYNKLFYKQNKLFCDNKCQRNDNNEIKKEILENKISSLNIANLKLDNSELLKNTLTEKKNLSNISEQNSNSEENELINLKDKIFNIKDFDNELKRYYKDKKRFNCRQRDFVNYGNKLYKKTNCKNYFELPETHLKNFHQKIKKEINPFNLSEIYEYCKNLKNFDNLCWDYEEKILINKEFKTFSHKHMIFYSDFDFKRIFVSEHILVDGTFVYPSDLTQTIIILYYDIITFKFIPGIFILINNKTQIDTNMHLDISKKIWINMLN